MTKPNHTGALKLVAVIIAVLMSHSGAFSGSAGLWFAISSVNSNFTSSPIFPVTKSQTNEALQIICPENISTYTDINECSADISNSLNVKVLNGALAKLTWTMEGATEATSQPYGINQIDHYIFNEGVTIIRYSGVDYAGNTSECSFTVVVSDNQAPKMSAPKSISVNCDDRIPSPHTTLQAFLNAGGNASDNCNLNPATFKLESEQKSNSVCPFTLTRTYQISDLQGNITKVKQSISVEEMEIEVTSEEIQVLTLKSGMAEFVAVIDGPWNVAATWGGAGIPGMNDNVTIQSGVTVTINVASVCNDIAINGTLNGAGNILQVYGNWTNNGSYNGGSNGIVEFTGTSNAVISGNTNFEELKVSKGSLSSTLTVNGTATVLSSGGLTLNSGLLTIPAGGSFNINPASALAIPRFAGFDLTGGNLTTGNFTITNEGLIRISSGTATFGTISGNSVHTQTDGAFIVTGGNVNIAGRLENSASGTLTPPGVTSGISISSGTVTLSTVGNGLSNVGTLNVTSAGNFNFTGGTIVFQRESTATTALDLGLISGMGTKTTVGGTFQFGNASTPAGTVFNISSEIPLNRVTSFPNANLKLINNVTIGQMTLNAGTTIDLNSNYLQLSVSAPGTYTFPLDNGSGTFIPVTINIISGSFDPGAFIEIETTGTDHPNNSSSTNYLNRYWTVTTNGITNPVYNITATYADADINGTESEIAIGNWTGSLPWVKGNVANTVANTISKTGITSPSFEFTGIRLAPPTVTISATNSSFCIGNSTTLTANPVGDPVFTYSWTSTPVGFTSTLQTFTVTPLVTTTYSVTVTDGNGFTANENIIITVIPENTITLTSAVGTDAQSRCINTALTNITYATTGANGASITGLPTGVTGTWSANVVTISGTPSTTAGSPFTYTITLTGGCGTVTKTGTISVTMDNTITLSSAAGTDAQSTCINIAITNITYNTTGASGATFSGLPPGVNGNWAGNVATISGTPSTTAGSPFTYTITLTGGCGNETASGTITVIPIMTVTAASPTSPLCINTTLTAITHTTTLATGISNDGVAGANGLPAGVSAHWNANVITISGTPTASGTFNYSIPLTGGCGTVNATGTITVTPDMTVSAASSSPTPCINTWMTNITHTTTGATGIGPATGLPAGVTATWASNTITVGGYPTIAGTYNYSIPLTGVCGIATATGTIIVNPDNTMTLTSGENNPRVCINSPLTNIVFSTTGATGATITGLPPGVSGIWAANTVTISGTPTSAGSFPYTILLTGGCGTKQESYWIYVNPLPTLSVASQQATACAGTSATINLTGLLPGSTSTITYTINGIAQTPVTGVTANASGAASFSTAALTEANNGQTLQITGITVTSATPSCSNTFAVNVTLSVDPASVGGTIASSQTICNGTTPADLTLSAYTGNIVKWQRAGNPSFTGATDIAITSTTLTGATIGNLTATTYFRAVVQSGVCSVAYSTTAIITVQGSVSAGTIGTAQNICYGDVPVALTGSVVTGSGTITYLWEQSIDNGTTWTVISGEIGSTYAPPALIQNTRFRRKTVSTLNGVECTSGPTTVAGILITVRPEFIAPVIASIQSTICYNTSPGQLTITTSASGGSSPYSYQWQSSVDNVNWINVGASSSSPNPYNAPALTVSTHYRVRVTSSCGTVYSNVVLITVNPQLLATKTQTNVSCFGGATGSVTATATPGTGTAPYEYSINGGINWQASGTFNGLAAGSYTVIVRDAALCTVNVPVTITQPLAALFATVNSKTNVLCFGNSTGSVTVVTAAGTGTSPYQYSIDGGTNWQATGTFNLLAAGNYTVTVRDALLCTFPVPVTITQPAAALAATITDQTNVLCFGNSTGSVTVTATAGTGTAPYQYSINGGVNWQATGTFTGRAAGNYTVIVRDAAVLCTFNVPVTITQPAALAATITTQTNVLCFGELTGSVTVTATAGTGTAPYQYSINNGTTWQPSGTFNGLAVGSYTVIVRDAGPCTINVPVTITQPASAITASASSNTPVCEGSTLNLTATASGGNGTLTYSWTGPNGFTSNQQNPSISNATPAASGTYEVTVSDANACTKTANTLVTVYPTPTLINPGPQEICNFSATNIPLNTTITGFTVTYTWTAVGSSANVSGYSNCSTMACGSTIAQTISNSGISVETVTYTITPHIGLCSGPSQVVVVTINPSPVMNDPANVTICGGSATNIALTTQITGGTVTYTWTAAASSGNVSGYSDCNSACGSTIAQTLSNSGTSVETVTYTVTPHIGLCSGSAQTVVVTVNPGAVMNDPPDVTICNGATINIPLSSSITGGTVTYTWTATASSGNVSGFSDCVSSCGSTISQTLTNSGTTSETVTYTITPSLGSCPGTAQNVVVTVRPALIPPVVSGAQTICYNSTPATLNATAATGGSGPAYTYQWQSSPNNLTWTDVTGANSLSYSPLALIVNTYYRVVASDNGTPACNPVNSNSVMITVQSQTTAGSIAPNQQICNGAAPAPLNSVSNGTGSGTIEYIWQQSIDGGTNWTIIAGATSAGYAPPALTQTTLFRRITVATLNSVACNSLPTNPVTVTVNQVLTAPVASASQTICYETAPAQLSATAATGGNGSYNYLWQRSLDNFSTWNDLTGEIALTYNPPVLTSTTYYRVRTIDGGATPCGTVYSNIITITVPPLLQPSILSQTNVLCFGNSTGSATATAIGGTPGYNYSWNTVPVQITATATNLAAGTYMVTVTDANNCAKPVQVIITQPAASLEINTTQVDVFCYGSTTGTATANPTGGTGPYTYSWNTTPVQNTKTATGLAAGTYIVTVTDANLCTVPASVTISQPAAGLTVTTTQVNVLCYGSTTGTATANPLGGSGIYTYSWNTTPVQNTKTAIGLAAGTYIVTVTDENSCTFPASVTITQPAAELTVTTTQVNVLCNGDNNGTATANPLGGTGLYSYSWNTSPVQNTKTVTGLAAGTYIVTVTDENLCTVPATVTITQPAALNFTTTQVNVLCYGNSTGSATVTAIPGTGTAPYEYSIDGGASWQVSGTFVGLAAGDYTIIVRDAASCTISVPITITQPATPLTVSGPSLISICAGITLNLTATVTGGTPNFTYSWSGPNGFTSSSQNPSIPNATTAATGSYTVTVTDAGGCQDNTIINVNVDPAPNVTLSATTPVCEGQSVTLTATNSNIGSSLIYSGITNTPLNLPIQKNSLTGAYAEIPLSGSGGLTLANTDIIQVTLNIRLAQDQNLDIFLVAPGAAGAMLLSSDNGGTGQGYTNTIFRTDATNIIGSIGNNTAPFPGTYRPEGTISTPPDRSGAAPNNGGNYNSVLPANSLLGAPIDGTWTLWVFDDNSGTFANRGIFDDWSISIIRLPDYTTSFSGPGVIGAVSYASNIATATVTNVPVGVQNYTATTTNLIGCSTTSAPAVVTVNPTPTVDAVSNVTYCPGDAGAAINFTGSVSGTIYNWTSTIDVGFGTSGIGDIAAFTAVNATSSTVTTTVTVTPTANGCPGTAGTFTVTVNPEPTVSATNTAQPPICSGTAIANILITNPNAISGTTFSWTRDNTTNLTGIADSGTDSPISGTLTNITNTDQITVFTIRATSLSGCFSETTATVTVKPTPTVSAQATLAACSGQAITPIEITNPNGVTGVTYSWTRDNNPNLSGVALSGNGSPITGTFINSSATAQSTTFTITATANGCSSTTTTVVTVSPGSTVNAIPGAPFTYCSGALTPAAINFVSTPAGATFTWTSSADVGFGTSGIGDIPIYAATNPGTTPLVATVTVTPTINGCPGTPRAFTITVNPTPDANITADYCIHPGYIRLTAHPVPPGYTYLWSNGATTPTIDIDIAGMYSVTVTQGSCSATAFLAAANELITDGSFTNFNAAAPSFFTEYIQHQAYYTGVTGSGLWPEGRYAVNIQAWYNNPASIQGYHPNFHGRDHTNNSVGRRNFMMINGSTAMTGVPPHNLVIWQQTVPVVPGTPYYFSAWAMNINPASPATLRFEVNGVLVGTQATGTAPINEGQISLSNWERFYSNPTWTPGPGVTTAVVRIVNTNIQAGGNDFALDDISFGTMATIPAEPDPQANSGDPLCEGDTLKLTANVTGGKEPITYSWSGPNGFTSILQNPSIPNATVANSGVYTLTITDGYGCTPVDTFTIATINPAPSGTIEGTTTVCINATYPQLTFTGSIGTAPYTFTYNINGGANQTITTISGNSVTLPVPTGSAGTFDYTLTNVTDANGCSTTLSSSATVTVYDLPVCAITGANSVCPNSTGNIYTAPAGMTSYAWSISGNGTIVGATNEESVTVNAGSNCNSSFTLEVTITNPGCSSTCTYPVNTIDNQAPVITGTLTQLPVEGCDISSAPAALTTIAALKVLPGAINISDNCTAEDNLTVSHSDASAGTCPVVLTRTYTVTDACGNSSTIDHIINISDTQAPTLTGTIPTGGSNIVTCFAEAPTGPTTDDIAALYNDNCSSVTVSKSGTPTGTNCVWSVTYTYSVTDDCGNTVTPSPTVTYSGGDTQAPSLTGTIPLGTSGIVGCIADAPAGPAPAEIAALFTENCSTVTVTKAGTPMGTDCAWSVTYTYTVTDDCGYTVTPSPTVTYSGGDTQAPTLIGTIPTGTSGIVGCIADAPTGPAVADIAALYTDNCGAVTVTKAGTPTGTNCAWSVTYIYTVMDACGNTVPSSPSVTYSGGDTQAPVIAGSLTPATVEGCNISALPAAATTVAQLEALPGAIAITDACTPDASLTVTHADVVNGTCPIAITRTYTVTDECNNSTTVVHDISIDDTTPPTITTCPPAVNFEGCSVADITGLTYSSSSKTITEAQFITAGGAASDVCGIASYSYADTQSGTCLITVTRTFTVTDVCGNASTCQQTITVTDSQPPVITTCPADQTLPGCDISALAGLPVSTGEAFITMAQFIAEGGVASDACGITSISYIDFQAGNCPLVIERTFTISDACGHSASCMQTISIDDTQAPIVVCPASQDIDGCSTDDIPGLSYSATTVTISVAQFNAEGGSISDDCTIASVTYFDSQSGTCPIIVLRTFTVVDGCNNTTVCTQTFTINDTQAPVITTCPSSQTIEGCGVASIPGLAFSSSTVTITQTEFAAAGGAATDNCGITTFEYIDTQSGTCPVIVTRVFSLADGCNPPATCTQTFTINDTQSPSITCPAAQNIEGCNLSAIAAATSLAFSAVPVSITQVQFSTLGGSVSDACGITSFTYSDTQTGTCPIVVTRTFTATDACGHVSTCEQTINVNDTQEPVITTCPPSATIEGCGLPTIPILDFSTVTVDISYAQFSAVGGAANDGCGITSITYVDTQTGSCPTVVSRVFTLTDDCGHFATCTQTFTVNDTQTPVIATCPPTRNIEGCDLSALTGLVFSEAPVTISAADFTAAGGVATDACGITLYSYSDTQTSTCPIVVTRTFTLTDDCNHSATCQQTINVDDNSIPQITACPPTQNLSGCDLSAISGLGYSATSVTITQAQFAAAGGAATDACNLSYSYMDTQTGSCPIAVTRVFTVADACGNTANCTQTINITDNNPPQITTCPPSYDIEGCDTDAITGLVFSLTPVTITQLQFETAGGVATDACGITSFVYVDVQNGTCPVTVNRTFTLTDACNLSSVCLQTITINDNTAPQITTCPPLVNLEGCSTTDITAATGLAYSDNPVNISLEQFTAAGGTATDACGIVTYRYQDSQTGTCPVEVTRTFTVIDACNNSTSCTQTINVDDNTLPQITTCPPTLNLEGCGTSSIPDLVYSDISTTITEAQFTAAGGVVTDACGDLIYSYMDVQLNNCPTDVNRTFTITDACGNFTNCTQAIHIDDTEAPVISVCPENITAEGCDLASLTGLTLSTTDVSISAADFVAAGGDAYDLCGITSYSYFDVASGTCELIVTRTFTLSDACNNTISCIQTLTLTDNTNPTITCIADQSVGTNNVTTYIHSGTGWDALVTDACSSVTQSAELVGATTISGLTTLAGVIFNIGTTQVTWTATDACNNTNSCTFEVVVIGTADLEITKTDSPDPVEAGQVLTYTITITNLGPALVPIVTLTDVVPGVLSNVQFTVDGSPESAWTGSLILNNMALNDTRTIIITGRVDCAATGTITNTATVSLDLPLTDPDAGNNTATATTTVIAPLPPDPGTYGPVCIDDADIPLIGSPPGGIWSGTGVSGSQATGYVFDPSVGPQTLTYTDINGCGNSATTTIIVNPLPGPSLIYHN